jgi:glutaredoxin
MKKSSMKKPIKKKSIKKKKNDGAKKKKDNIVVVSLKGCDSCIEAKKLLDSKKMKFKNVEYEMSDTESKNLWNNFILNTLKKEHKTFPKIFINNNFIGGFNDLQQLLDK